MDNFQVDVILSSLRELQEEKCRNEKVLAEEYTKRKQLETQLESAIAKHKSVAQNNAKMRESMKVAEMKVAQTQAQVKMYEQVNDERKQRITDLKQQIEEQELKRQGQLGTFESQMKELTEKFRTSWHQSGEDALDTSLVQHKAKKDSLSSVITSNIHRLSELSQQIAQTEAETEDDTVGDIPTTTWKTVLDMFIEENEAAKAEVERNKQALGLDELKQQRTMLTTQLEELETQIINTTGSTSQHHEE